MFFQTSLESGLGSWILRLVDLVWIPPWPGPASLVILSVWGPLGSMGRATLLIVSCQEVSYQTVQSLIDLGVFLIPFPFIVSSWSLRGGQSPVVAAHSYCGGKGGLVDVTTWALSAWLQGVHCPWVTQQQAKAELQQDHQWQQLLGSMA